MSIVEAIPRNKPLVIFAIIAIIGVATVPSLAPHVFHGMHIVDLITVSYTHLTLPTKA